MDFLFGDITTLLHAIGILGVFFVVFAESGLLIGIILPGDTFLFTAGLLASSGYFNIFFLIIAAFLGAVLGDSFGYAFGKKVGPAIFTREDSLLFHKTHLARAEHFYKRFGGTAIVYARFLPFARTFAPILAGVGSMPYRKFLFFNVIGGALWAIGLPLTGFFLGTAFPDIERFIIYILFGVMSITVAPPIIHILWKKDSRQRIKDFLTTFLSNRSKK